MSDSEEKVMPEEALEPEEGAAEGVGVEPGAEAGDVDIAALQAQLVEAQEKVVEAEDKVLRASAEAQNIRRRAEKDVSNARKFALEKFAGSLLEVVDNLERALEAADTDNEQVKSLCDGVELTRKSFIDVLDRFAVCQVDPAGEPFDPELHQAMSMIESPTAEPNTVLQVMQKGYTLSGRLLRPAMVVVSKATSPKLDETV